MAAAKSKTDVNPEGTLFQFFSVTLGHALPRVPRTLSRLSPKAEEYASALARLAVAGNPDAKKALKIFREAAIRQAKLPGITALRNLYAEGAVAVNLMPGARWKMDPAGFLSLQLVLRIWLSRQTPKSYPGTGELALVLPGFDYSESWKCWELAKIMIEHDYSDPSSFHKLVAMVEEPANMADPKKSRAYMLGRLRRRFFSFLPLPPQV